jgi:hypothetical protein
VTVHVDRRGRVFHAKSRAVPPRLLEREPDFRVSRSSAVQRARRALGRADRPAAVQRTERLWFPREAEIVEAWRVRLARRGPREEWIVYVNARTGGPGFPGAACSRARA